MSDICIVCSGQVNEDEVAITKKLINRGATSYYCTSCLAEHFSVSEADILERIDYFKKAGCTLFPENKKELT